jgi:hypothetical protein
LRIQNGNYEAGAFNGSAAPFLSVPMPAGDVGTWVHLAATFSGSTWTLYRNGVAIGSNASGTPLLVVNTNWGIGSRGGGGDRFFSGKIDETRIYNRALSSSEMATLAASSILFSASAWPRGFGKLTLSGVAKKHTQCRPVTVLAGMLHQPSTLCTRASARSPFSY